MLSDRLAELCSVGLATRTVDEGPPISVAYELTDAGRALLRALEQISRWAEEHLPAPDGGLADQRRQSAARSIP